MLLLRLCTTGDALEAEPWLIQLRCVLTQGRVKTVEMKCPVASVTAEEEPASVTGGTEIGVVRLWVKCQRGQAVQRQHKG